jgi:hypothetical protein
MKREEAQRRILDLLVKASDSKNAALVDRRIAELLEMDIQVVQGNLLLLQEAGYVDIAPIQWIGVSRQPMVAALSPKGYVLLQEPGDTGTEQLDRARAMLAIMEQQIALFGFGYAPPYLIVSRDEQRRLVAELEAQQKPMPVTSEDTHDDEPDTTGTTT